MGSETTALPGQGALPGARQPPQQQHRPPAEATPRGLQAEPPQGPQQPLIHFHRRPFFPGGPPPQGPGPGGREEPGPAQAAGFPSPVRRRAAAVWAGGLRGASLGGGGGLRRGCVF